MYLGFLCFISPAILLGIIAQLMVRSAYARARREPATMSGFAAARRILDSAGLSQVEIHQAGGHLSDHYDPRDKSLSLSGDVYHGRTMAAVGIAAHEAGHALQDAAGYLPLVVRGLAAPAASFGSVTGMLLMFIGAVLNYSPLLLLGVLFFSAVVLFQLVNLPVEFNASSRAKAQLVQAGIVDPSQMSEVNRVLNAAALTYVAATLQSVLTLLYYALRLTGRR